MYCIAVSAALRHEGLSRGYDETAYCRPRSNYGNTTVDVAAPGDNVLSTYIGSSQYTTMTGTSVAVPHVTGTAALLIAQYASLTHLQP